MTAEDFVTEMCLRFNLFQTVREPGTGKDVTRIRPEKTSAKNDFKEFAQKNGSILETVFDRVKDEWEFNWAPNKAALNKMAGAIIDDIKHEAWEREQAAASSKIVQCQECDLLYDVKSAICPRCWSRRQARVFAVGGLEYKHVQPDCYRCLYYRKGAPEGKRLFGPACKYFGDINGGDIEGEKTGKHPCKSCACYECCKMESLFNDDPAAYKREYGDKNCSVYKPGTYEPVWIDPEVPVLGVK